MDADVHGESAYQALTSTDGDDNARWAFGTGFHDPLAGVDATVPEGVDRDDLVAYCLMLGDDALVASQRLTALVTHLPELETEMAVANVALDLLGQARLLLSRAAQVEDAGRDEDDLAYRRVEHELRNVRLVERPNGDFAETMVRLLVVATWRHALMQRLASSRDPVLAAVAAKAVPELRYHRDLAAGWVVRLGDGTDESRRRTVDALAATWPWIDELFATHRVEASLAEAGVAVDPATLRADVDAVVDEVIAAAGLERPETRPRAGVGGRLGRDGAHTEALGPLLAELQSVARQHPEATW